MSLLFSPRNIGPLTLRNRVIIAPMCQYSAIDGVPQPWHAQHLGKMAISGAAAVIVEATGVEAAGRITPDDVGLWNDAQADAFADILKGIRTYSDTPIGVQLAHAGRKASTSAPWKGGGALAAEDGAWETYAPSALPFRDDWHTPIAMTEADMDRIVAAFEGLEDSHTDGPLSQPAPGRFEVSETRRSGDAGEDAGGGAPHRLHRLAHGGECRRAEPTGQDAIEPGDGHLVGHAHAEPGDPRDHQFRYRAFRRTLPAGHRRARQL